MIEVREHRGLEGLDAAQMERLNRDSRCASPLASPKWLAAFLAHDATFRSSGAEAVTLAAWEGSTLRGYLPLKRATSRLGTRLSGLITLEVERPQVVALPADEALVAGAFGRWLLHRSDEWDLFELSQQVPASPLYESLGASPRHFFRRLPDRDNNIVPITWKTPEAYAAALDRRHRSNCRRHFRDLFAAGTVTLVGASAAPSRGLLFDVFLDVERRSWKARADATMTSREATYRVALEDPAAPFDLKVAVLLLDGLPIAGTVWGVYGESAYHLQSTFAESHEGLSPGTLMAWLPARDAVALDRKAFNFLPDYSYYKSRWLAETVKTETAQTFRIGSRYHLKAMAGDFLRKLKESPGVAQLSNPHKEAAPVYAAPPPVDLAKVQAQLERARAAGAWTWDAAALKARCF